MKRDIMKFKTLIASVAFLALGTAAAEAADLGVRPAPLPPPVPVLNWTGFYAGVNIGGAWANNTWTESRFGTNFGNNGNSGAFIGGGQIGGNYQIDHFVVGGEWDFDWAGSHNGPPDKAASGGGLHSKSLDDLPDWPRN